MKRLFILVAGAAGLVSSTCALTVTDVSAHARYPWQSVIDVDFTISDTDVASLFRAEVTASYSNGEKRLVASTYLTEPVCGYGENRITWDVGADYPGLKADDLKVSVSVAPVNADATDVYMVVDLSSGPNSPRYPVSYTFAPPVLVPTNDLVACAADPNRTTKLWLKRVKGSVYPFHGTDSNGGKGWYNVKLSPYYIGVFELTQMQWALVMDSWPGGFTNATYRAARPVENVLYTDVIGHYNWPDDKTVSADSFVGRMRARTGLETFNLPTEAQWECACRAGDKGSVIGTFATFPFRYNKSVVVAEGDLTYNENPDSGTALVGSYKPNDWGFYDFYGNVLEMCLDAYIKDEDMKVFYGVTDPVTDPVGPATRSTAYYHVTRGGAWYNGDYCNNYSRTYGYSLLDKPNKGIGLRVAVSPEWR